MNRKGFTLVELIVSITIIGILSVIAYSNYSSVQKSARDARRRGDIDAIATALEANKTPTGYIALANSQFSSGNIPYDPKRTSTSQYPPAGGEGCGGAGSDQYANGCWYCLRRGSSGNQTQAACGNGDYRIDGSDVADPTIPAPSFPKSWIVCANLETGGTGYYCKVSQQ